MDCSRTLPADVSLFDAVASVAGDGIVQLDDRDRIVRFSPAAEALLGFSAQSVMGSPFAALLHESARTAAWNDSGTVQTQSITMRDSAGAAVTVRARSVALQRAGSCEGRIVAFAPKARVEEIEQLKNELVSTVSHELKTPLAAIKAYSATLRQNPALYESHREEFLRVVEQQADRLTRLVDDMLMVTRVETGQMLRRRMDVPLDTLVAQALQELPHDPVRHPIELRSHDMVLSGDPERLRDIMRNLLENALKYSPAGGSIEITGRVEDGTAVVAIRDNGIGIAAADLPYIFDRFYRVESQNTASVGGSGLGLYIVHALVRAHGGSVHAQSEPGAGSTFTLRLPLR